MLVCSGYAALQGLRVPEVHEQAIHLLQLPPELDGLRIAVIADLHGSAVNNATYVRKVVDRVNAAKPDLIVLPGDLVDGDAATQATHIAPLADLRAPHGIWAAPGNHEYYSGYAAWAKVFAQSGLRYLANQAETLEVRGQRLTISGVGDPAYAQHHNTGGVPPDIARVAQQARAQHGQFHILLGHQPKMARHYADQHSVDLQIAGHTHGGHILGFDQWVVAPANNGFVRGIYPVSDMTLFVSSGAGLWAGFTLRLGIPASIDLLVLRRPQSQ
jgi:predicted MPP superfamily phosphohydrolase